MPYVDTTTDDNGLIADLGEFAVIILEQAFMGPFQVKWTVLAEIHPQRPGAGVIYKGAVVYQGRLIFPLFISSLHLDILLVVTFNAVNER